MDILYATYPFSIGFILLVCLICTSIVAFIAGIFGAVILIICLYLGVVRVIPILKILTSLFDKFNPGLLEKMKKNIRKNFLVEYSYGTLPNTPHIFAFHPHGIFSVSNALHIGTRMTNWSHIPIKGTVSDKVTYIPGFEEIIEFGNFVTSNYKNMKSVLDNETSLTVCMGGVRELIYIQPNKLSLTISKKQGIFRLAIETGKPLVPVITYGENDLLDIIDSPFISWIQPILVHYGICMPILSLESFKRWYKIVNEPMKHPIRTVIGKPIDVGSPRKATEQEIIDLRERYFIELRELYKKTKPEFYAEDIEII